MGDILKLYYRMSYTTAVHKGGWLSLGKKKSHLLINSASFSDSLYFIEYELVFLQELMVRIKWKNLGETFFSNCNT